MLKTGIQWLALSFIALVSYGYTEEKLKALIVDGQNNHAAWPKTTMMMKSYLEKSGLFTVDIARTQFTWNGDKWLEAYPLNDGVKTRTSQTTDGGS